MAAGAVIDALVADQQAARDEFADHVLGLRLQAAAQARAQRVPGLMKVVATYSIKGGVGKTSAAVNLGALAARDGLRTVIWDLDPQGAASYPVPRRAEGQGRRASS